MQGTAFEATLAGPLGITYPDSRPRAGDIPLIIKSYSLICPVSLFKKIK